MPKIKDLSRSEKAFIKTLPPEYGDNWEDDLRKVFAKRRAAEYLPLLEELIDLDYPCEPLPFTQALLKAKSKKQLQIVIEEALKCVKN